MNRVVNLLECRECGDDCSCMLVPLNAAVCRVCPIREAARDDARVRRVDTACGECFALLFGLDCDEVEAAEVLDRVTACFENLAVRASCRGFEVRAVDEEDGAVRAVGDGVGEFADLLVVDDEDGWLFADGVVEPLFVELVRGGPFD